MDTILPDGRVVHVNNPILGPFRCHGKSVAPLIIAMHRGPGKTDLCVEQLKKLAAGEVVEGLITVNEAGVKAIHAFDELNKVFAKPEPEYKVKSPNWTPGQAAPLRRGRHR